MQGKRPRPCATPTSPQEPFQSSSSSSSSSPSSSLQQQIVSPQQRKSNPGMRTSFDLFTGKPLASQPEVHDYNKNEPSHSYPPVQHKQQNPHSFQPPPSFQPPSSSQPSSHQKVQQQLQNDKQQMQQQLQQRQQQLQQQQHSQQQKLQQQIQQQQQQLQQLQQKQIQQVQQQQIQKQVQQQIQTPRSQQSARDGATNNIMQKQNNPPASATDEANKKRLLELDRKIKVASAPSHEKFVRMPYATDLSHNEQKQTTEALEHQLMNYCLEKNQLDSEYARMTHPRNHQQLKRKTEVESRLDFLTKEISRLRMDLREKKVL